MNVFVLCAGRTASTTFATACSHIEGFTAGHETRTGRFFDDRLKYPKNHVEVDNRLAFFLGGLDAKYGDNAYYVHLTRNADAVAASYRKRWYYRGSIVRAFYSNIMMLRDYNERAMADACQFYVETNQANIEHFLKDKSHTFHFDLSKGKEEFRRFVAWLGRDCRNEGYAAWDVLHNLNRSGGFLTRIRRYGGRFARTLRAMPIVYRDM